MSEVIDTIPQSKLRNPLFNAIWSLDSSGNPVGLVGPGGEPVISLATSAFTPYRLATFGDSRVNAGGTHLTTVTAASISGEKVPGALCCVRGDMQVVFNGGISGDSAANWNSAGRVSTNQTVRDLMAATPDLVLIQYGINDIIAGAPASTVAGYLQALIDKLLGVGIPVIFESVNPCATSSVSYINGYGASGGFGASAAAKLTEMQSLNAIMESWMTQFPKNITLYVDTSAATTGVDGYAKTDGTYYDGTHLSRIGCMAVAKAIDVAIRDYFPIKRGQRIKGIYPNGINRSFLSPSSGRAANFNAITVDNGTATATYQIVEDADGDLCQEYNVTVTGLGGSTCRMFFGMIPDWAGASPFFSLAAGDVLQAAFDYTIDDGAGGQPIVHEVYGRGRIFYDDASNEYTQHGAIAVTTSTDFPVISDSESGKILTPRLAVKAALASANMLGTTTLQCHVISNQLGTFRLRIKNPQWLKVA